MKKTAEKILFRGKWVTLKESTWQNARGEQFQWEHLERVRGNHAVIILATLRPSGKVVLIKQFRPGTEGDVIGLPAGICEDGSIEENALRELKEETGYEGTITSISPVMSSFPALSSSTMQLVHVDVDETKAVNQNPCQNLETGEEISVHTMLPSEIPVFLQKQQSRGCHIVSGIWYLFCVNTNGTPFL